MKAHQAPSTKTGNDAIDTICSRMSSARSSSGKSRTRPWTVSWFVMRPIHRSKPLLRIPAPFRAGFPNWDVTSGAHHSACWVTR